MLVVSDACLFNAKLVNKLNSKVVLCVIIETDCAETSNVRKQPEPRFIHTLPYYTP